VRLRSRAPRWRAWRSCPAGRRPRRPPRPAARCQPSVPTRRRAPTARPRPRCTLADVRIITCFSWRGLLFSRKTFAASPGASAVHRTADRAAPAAAPHSAAASSPRGLPPLPVIMPRGRAGARDRRRRVPDDAAADAGGAAGRGRGGRRRRGRRRRRRVARPGAPAPPQSSTAPPRSSCGALANAEVPGMMSRQQRAVSPNVHAAGGRMCRAPAHQGAWASGHVAHARRLRPGPHSSELTHGACRRRRGP